MITGLFVGLTAVALLLASALDSHRNRPAAQRKEQQ